MSSAWPLGFLIRVVLTQDDTYKKALSSLSSSTLMSPTFIILAGSQPGEGALITRNRDDQEKPWLLNVDGDIVQTNIDHWSNDSRFDIIWSIDRRNLVRTCFQELDKKKRGCNFDLMRDIFQNSPVFNDETIYMTMMCPRKNQFISYLPPIYGTSNIWQ